MVGFSVVVFSTLSSSVNKTTSSKASGSESVALRDFGGKNQPCIPDDPQRIENRELICNENAGLVCSAPLDFWLRHKDSRDFTTETKCLEYVDIPMGKEGQLCRKAEQGKRQCESGLTCANVFKDEPPAGLTKTFDDYLVSKYKGDKRLGKELSFEISKDLRINFSNYNNDYYRYGATGIPNFVYMTDTSKNFVEPRGICIPDNFTKVESCGDAGQRACINEKSEYYCFGDNRVIRDGKTDNSICVPKIKVTSKDLFSCDDQSSSCNEFCSGQNARCVETCDDKVLVDQGGEVGLKEMTVKAGLFDQGNWNGGPLEPKKSGTCSQTYSPSLGQTVPLYEMCRRNRNTYCCCDKIK